jgi:hypothetical protein
MYQLYHSIYVNGQFHSTLDYEKEICMEAILCLIETEPSLNVSNTMDTTTTDMTTTTATSATITNDDGGGGGGGGFTVTLPRTIYNRLCQTSPPNLSGKALAGKRML